MNSKYLILTALLSLVVSIGDAQSKQEILTSIPSENYENIHVLKLDSDKHSSSFLIWIKKEVKAHKHEKHSEAIYILEGEGNMRLGEKEFMVKAGDYIFVPEGTVHSVKVTSGIPMKVLSVQAPEFLGNDRIFVD